MLKKMIKKLVFAALCVLSATEISYSREDWYEPAIRISGRQTVGMIEEGAVSALIHVRIKAPEWSVIWPSARGLCRATLSLPPSDRQDDVYVAPATLTVETGNKSEVYHVDGDVAYDDYNSIKIDYDGVNATLIVGSESAREVTSVPIAPGEVSLTLTGEGLCRRIQLTQLNIESITDHYEGGITQLIRRITSSDDLNEGFWEYFGKDADPAKVSVGGHYVLATVADGKGGYDIIYVDGAVNNSGRWQPTAIKGHIRPTIFADDFDLKWIDVNGHPVPGDTYARMSSDRSMISFGFPSQSATLKFRRVPNSEIIQKAGS